MERPSDFAPAQVPNDVWRLLDLQSTGYQGRRPPKVFLAAGDKTLRPIFSNQNENERALESEEEGAGALLRDFLKRLSPRPEGAHDGLNPLITDSANDVLDDYFGDENLKARMAGLALIPYGLAGDEPGSAVALRRVDPDYWPAEIAEDAPSLADALAAICANRQVARLEGAVRALEEGNGRGRTIELETGERFRAQTVMASSVEQARCCNLAVAGALAPVARRFGAEGFIRIILDGPNDASGPEDGLYVICADRSELKAARSAMREGRTPTAHPLLVEIKGRMVLARAPYCPYRLIDDEGARDWTGQDRQALGRQIHERIKGALGLKRPAQSIEVRVDAFENDQALLGHVYAPDPQLPSIEGAARCALALIDHV